MNNKKLGTQWEKDFCKILSDRGWWVHFINPDNRGAQPFDIIAVKNGIAHVYDCKTCVSNNFSMTRLEDNQIMAFEKWIWCGNAMPSIAVLHKGKCYIISYLSLKVKYSINLEKAERYEFEEVFDFDTDNIN